MYDAFFKCKSVLGITRILFLYCSHTSCDTLKCLVDMNSLASIYTKRCARDSTHSVNQITA